MSTQIPNTIVYDANGRLVPQSLITVVPFASPTFTGTLTAAAIISNSTTAGFLPPRMTTTQRDAIATPAEGLQIWNTTDHVPNFYDGTSWKAPTLA